MKKWAYAKLYRIVIQQNGRQTASARNGQYLLEPVSTSKLPLKVLVVSHNLSNSSPAIPAVKNDSEKLSHLGLLGAPKQVCKLAKYPEATQTYVTDRAI